MKCLDGPAMGKAFSVRRCPWFLRVVQDRETEKWDVLDLLDDEPRPGESIHVYLRTTRVNVVFVRPGGRYEMADYRHVPTMPEEEAELRDQDRWHAWVDAKASEFDLPGVRSPGNAATNHEEGTMEDPNTQGTEGELREEDVTKGDNLDDSVAEGEDLPAAQAGGTAEGEDAPADDAE